MKNLISKRERGGWAFFRFNRGGLTKKGEVVFLRDGVMHSMGWRVYET